MSLDIHISKSEKEVIKSTPISSFSEVVHDLLFYCVGVSESKYPLFFRMNDYFSDAKYNAMEIEYLAMEIINMKIEFKENKQIVEELDNLKSICVKAQEEGLNIWVYCD